MSYSTIIHRLPQDIQYPMLELVETLQQDMRAQYAVRREDYEALAAATRTLAEGQSRLEYRVDRLENAVTELAEAQQRTEQRVEELAQAQQRTEQRVEELAQAQKRTEDVLQRLVIRVAKNTGILLELDYRDKAFAYFGTILRKVKVISLQELEPNLESQLSESEFDALLPLDLLVYGQVRHAEKPTDVYLAVEVSSVVDGNDVARALQRTALLRKAGYRTVATVAGEEATDSAVAAAEAGGVLVVQNGTKQYWEQAFARALQSTIAA